MKTLILRQTLLFVIVLLFSSCGPLIFSANFESDSVGNAPNPNPPGEPSGDEIKGNCGITVVNSTTIGSKAMRFFNDSSCFTNLMWFESDNVPTSNNFLNYTFIGSPESTTHRDFTISFAGGHFASAFEIKYDNGTMLLTDGSFTNHNIGTYTANEKQTFLVGINRDTNEYSITIARQGASNISFQNRLVKASNFWGQSVYILYAFYDTNDSNSSPNGYVFDEVKINKEDVN